MNAELMEFTREALRKGVERSEIAGTLELAGWDKAEVSAALACFAEVDFPIPVPRPRPYLSASEVFLYLVMFAALYVAIYCLGSLLFNFIDHSFPDPAHERNWRNFTDAVRWNVSSLIISFPLFLITFRATCKAVAAKPDRRGSRPRKWLTYLTLFLSLCVIAGDMITLIYNVLGGELSIRFVLKVATIAILAGGVFAYFLTDIRKDEVV